MNEKFKQISAIIAIFTIVVLVSGCTLFSRTLDTPQIASQEEPLLNAFNETRTIQLYDTEFGFGIWNDIIPNDWDFIIDYENFYRSEVQEKNKNEFIEKNNFGIKFREVGVKDWTEYLHYNDSSRSGWVLDHMINDSHMWFWINLEDFVERGKEYEIKQILYYFYKPDNSTKYYESGLSIIRP